jgi:hypothetical protein
MPANLPDPRKRKAKDTEVAVLYTLAVLGVAMVVACATVMVVGSMWFANR